jgi:hypothetical protein
MGTEDHASNCSDEQDHRGDLEGEQVIGEEDSARAE